MKTNTLKRRLLSGLLVVTVLIGQFGLRSGAAPVVSHTEGVPNSFRADAAPDTIEIPVTLWDQKRDNTMFEGALGSRKNMVAKELGEDGTPVRGSNNPFTEAQFNRWFHDEEGTNLRVDSGTVTLTKQANGTYSYFPGSFFALDIGRGIASPEDELRAAKFSNGGKKGNNFYFTMKMETYFTYKGGESFKFSGDDDVWVFIDGKLALDLGGIHSRLEDTIHFGGPGLGLAEGMVKSGTCGTQNLGLEIGQTYTLSFFYAERHTSESNLGITTSLQLDSFDVHKQGTLSEDKEHIDYTVEVINTQKNLPITLTHIADWMNAGSTLNTDSGEFITFGDGRASGIRYSYDNENWQELALSPPGPGGDAFKILSPEGGLKIEPYSKAGDRVYFRYTYTLTEADKEAGAVFNKFTARTRLPNDGQAIVLYGDTTTRLTEISVDKSAALYDPDVNSELIEDTAFKKSLTLPEGAQAIFKVVLTNEGDYPGSVNLADTMSGGVRFVDGTGTLVDGPVRVQAGSSAIYYYVTEALAAGSYINTAAITGDAVKAGAGTAKATVDVTQDLGCYVEYYRGDEKFAAEYHPVTRDDNTVAYSDLEAGIAAHNRAGYLFEKVTFIEAGEPVPFIENSSVTVTEDSNIIRVYYQPDDTEYPYVINYLDALTDEPVAEAVTGTAIMGSLKAPAHPTVPGYTLVPGQPVSMGITADSAKNILNIYYIKHVESGLTVLHSYYHNGFLVGRHSEGRPGSILDIGAPSPFDTLDMLRAANEENSYTLNYPITVVKTANRALLEQLEALRAELGDIEARMAVLMSAPAGIAPEAEKAAPTEPENEAAAEGVAPDDTVEPPAPESEEEEAPADEPLPEPEEDEGEAEVLAEAEAPDTDDNTPAEADTFSIAPAPVPLSASVDDDGAAENTLTDGHSDSDVPGETQPVDNGEADEDDSSEELTELRAEARRIEVQIAQLEGSVEEAESTTATLNSDAEREAYAFEYGYDYIVAINYSRTTGGNNNNNNTGGNEDTNKDTGRTGDDPVVRIEDTLPPLAETPVMIPDNVLPLEELPFTGGSASATMGTAFIAAGSWLTAVGLTLKKLVAKLRQKREQAEG